MNYAFIAMNIMAGFLIILLISNSKLPLINLGALTKAGLWIGGVGLFCQALRDGFKIFFESFPFSDLPIWMLKDVGYWFIAIGFLLHIYESRKAYPENNNL